VDATRAVCSRKSQVELPLTTRVLLTELKPIEEKYDRGPAPPIFWVKEKKSVRKERKREMAHILKLLSQLLIGVLRKAISRDDYLHSFSSSCIGTRRLHGTQIGWKRRMNQVCTVGLKWEF
jgi:hypothetical protein